MKDGESGLGFLLKTATLLPRLACEARFSQAGPGG